MSSVSGVSGVSGKFESGWLTVSVFQCFRCFSRGEEITFDVWFDLIKVVFRHRYLVVQYASLRLKPGSTLLPLVTYLGSRTRLVIRNRTGSAWERERVALVIAISLEGDVPPPQRYYPIALKSVYKSSGVGLSSEISPL